MKIASDIPETVDLYAHPTGPVRRSCCRAGNVRRITLRRRPGFRGVQEVEAVAIPGRKLAY